MQIRRSIGFNSPPKIPKCRRCIISNLNTFELKIETVLQKSDEALRTFPKSKVLLIHGGQERNELVLLFLIKNFRGVNK